MGYKTHVKMKKLILVFSVLISSCTLPTIEKGDIVKYCVIDTFYTSESLSTLEYGTKYHYVTNCNQVITTRRNGIYHIGDTITYVIKKPK